MLMKMLPSCLIALAFVSFAFSPPLAANSGLLNAAPESAPTSIPLQFSMLHLTVANVVPTTAPVTEVALEAPVVAEAPVVVEAEQGSSAAFSESERDALAALSLSDAEAVAAAGAGTVIIGIGGLLLIALIVILILVLTGHIQTEESDTAPVAA